MATPRRLMKKNMGDPTKDPNEKPQWWMVQELGDSG